MHSTPSSSPDQAFHRNVTIISCSAEPYISFLGFHFLCISTIQPDSQRLPQGATAKPIPSQPTLRVTGSTGLTCDGPRLGRPEKVYSLSFKPSSNPGSPALGSCDRQLTDHEPQLRRLETGLDLSIHPSTFAMSRSTPSRVSRPLFSSSYLIMPN